MKFQLLSFSCFAFALNCNGSSLRLHKPKPRLHKKGHRINLTATVAPLPQDYSGPALNPSVILETMPKQGDVYVGEMKCMHANIGLRLKIADFPAKASVTVFPLSHFDIQSHLFCRPLTTCDATYDVTGVTDSSDSSNDMGLHSDVMKFDPVPGKDVMQANCGTGSIGLTGSMTGPYFSGTLQGNTNIKARSDLRDPEYVKHSSPFCHNKEKGPGFTDGALSCTEFVVNKCVKEAPQPGEKVVYFVQMTLGEGATPGHDGRLTEGGAKLVANLEHNPWLAAAFLKDARHRVQKVFSSPTARSMETALLGFRKHGVHVVLEPNLMTHDEHYGWDRTKDMEVLQEYNATRLARQYELLWERTNSEGTLAAIKKMGHNDMRLTNFKTMLLAQPDQVLVIVAPQFLYHDASLVASGPGAVDWKVLKQDRTWRETSDPRCW